MFLSLALLIVIVYIIIIGLERKNERIPVKTTIIEANKGPTTIDGLTPDSRKLFHRPKIVDIEQLKKKVDIAWHQTETQAEFSLLLLNLFRTALADGSDFIRKRFLSKNDGEEAVLAQAFLMDSLIKLAFETINTKLYRAPNPTQGEQICIVAVGGYGRGELAPYSDIDLLFLLPYKQTPHVEQVVEAILYLLWDMKLKVGHSTRSIEECMSQAKQDMTVRTAILESRYICGESDLMDTMILRFHKEIVRGTALEFVEAKLKESDDRHRQLGDSRYFIEPNVKDGKGGLRDLHKLFWIGKYVYETDNVSSLVNEGVLSVEEARRFAKAQKQLWTIRCHLHYLARREEDRLTVDHQSKIAGYLGYTDRSGNAAVERFMKHYYLTAKDVGDLTRIFCAAIEEEHQRKPRLNLSNPWRRTANLGDFELEGDRLNSRDDEVFEKDPVNLVRMFYIAQQNELEFHPNILRLATKNLSRIDKSLRNNTKANELFINILTSPKGPERILRRMNEAQVFGRFVPDFGRVVAQMQYDMYHVYTVDEHTIIMLGILFKIEKGELKEAVPIASSIIGKVISRRELYVAVLLHDIAKGKGGDHSVLGEKIARRLCPRFGMTVEETETVAWLVRWHLLMSYAAFKRDVNDPKTIQDFTSIVRSPERLRLLLVLTVADIRAVGPNVWTSWKGALLNDLYFLAEEALSGQSAETGQPIRTENVHSELRKELSDWDDARFQQYIEQGYSSYWLAYDVHTLARHAKLVQRANEKQTALTIDTLEDQSKGATDVTVYAADHPGLFSRIAGALASVGASVVDAKITTMRNGMALDTFWVQDSNGDVFKAVTRLCDAIRETLSGNLKLNQAIAKRPHNLPKRTLGMLVPSRVLIDNKASSTHTVIEVNGRDSPGLLHRLTHKLAQQNLQISSAKISTYGASIVDVFYVKDLFGLKLQNDLRLQSIKKVMLQELELDKEDTN